MLWVNKAARACLTRSKLLKRKAPTLLGSSRGRRLNNQQPSRSFSMGLVPREVRPTVDKAFDTKDHPFCVPYKFSRLYELQDYIAYDNTRKAKKEEEDPLDDVISQFYLEARTDPEKALQLCSAEYAKQLYWAGDLELLPPKQIDANYDEKANDRWSKVLTQANEAKKQKKPFSPALQKDYDDLQQEVIKVYSGQIYNDLKEEGIYTTRQTKAGEYLAVMDKLEKDSNEKLAAALTNFKQLNNPNIIPNFETAITN